MVETTNTHGKVAIVTGASSGIGAATARRLSTGGYRVYAGARRTERMAELAALGIVPVSLDVTDDLSMAALVDRVMSEAGRIDLLVNNAGYGSYGAVEDVPIAEGRAQLEVNLFGLARLTQLVLPHMRAAGRGKVVNVSSVGGHFGEPLGAWYHASKFAVEGFSDSLRLELRDFGIDVIVVTPAAIKTEWESIALKGAERHSGEGAYADHVRGMRALYARAERGAVDPTVIADAIWAAVTARRPKARYVAPLFGRVLVTVRRVLPDAAFDRLLRRAIRRLRAAEEANQREPVSVR